jgi:chromosome segregation ATPase
MSDSDDTQALAAKIRGEGAAVAAAPPAREYPLDVSSSDDDEASTLPVKKRKAKGGRLTAPRKKTTRRVSGASEEAPSPNTAVNLLETQVNALDKEVETLTDKLAQSENNRKAGSATIALLNKQVKLLKEENKALASEEAAQEVGRLKRELATLSNASSKATRLADDLALEKASVKDLRKQIYKGTTGYTKVNSKYQQLKKDAAKAEAALKKDVAALETRLKDKAAKRKQDEAKVAAELAAREMAEYKLDLKMKREDERDEKKKKEAEAKEAKRRDNLDIASSVSSKGFTIPQNQQERAAIFQPHGAPYYHPQPAQQYLQPYAPPPHGYGHPMPMQQYQPGYQPYPMSGERIREGDQALPSSITVGTGQTGTLQQ